MMPQVCLYIWWLAIALPARFIMGRFTLRMIQAMTYHESERYSEGSVHSNLACDNFRPIPVE